MSLRFSFTVQARHDMDDIWAYVAEDNPVAADDLIDEFHQAVRKLADHPKLGRSREELARGLRSLALGNYIMFYRHLTDRLEVYRVLHGARDLPELL